MNPAHIEHLPSPLTLGDFLAQVRQPHISSIALNQILFSVLASAPAFLAGQPDKIARIFASWREPVIAVILAQRPLTYRLESISIYVASMGQ